MESDLCTADCIEATEFPELSGKYRVYAVPKTMINGRRSLVLKTLTYDTRDIQPSLRDLGKAGFDPALKRRAIVRCPSGTGKAAWHIPVG